MTRVLDQILTQMHDENPVGESKLFPGRPKLTNLELQQRHQLKKRLTQASLGPGGGGKHGGLERISDIVITKVREGLQEGILPITVKDGLAAEKLADARINRIDDRKAMLAVAVMLTGGGLAPPEEMLSLDDGLTIEGDFEEVDSDE